MSYSALGGFPCSFNTQGISVCCLHGSNPACFVGTLVVETLVKGGGLYAGSSVIAKIELIVLFGVVISGVAYQWALCDKLGLGVGS